MRIRLIVLLVALAALAMNPIGTTSVMASLSAQGLRKPVIIQAMFTVHRRLFWDTCVSFKNISNRTISGIRLQFKYFFIRPDLTAILNGQERRGEFLPGEAAEAPDRAGWVAGTTTHDVRESNCWALPVDLASRPRVEVRVITVRFADGSTWSKRDNQADFRI